MSEMLRQRINGFTDLVESRANGTYPYYRTIESASGAHAWVSGQRVLMFGSNDYLGLASHPRVKEAARAAIDHYGTGMAGSRLLNGSIDLHTRLEAALSELTHKPAAIVFASGYQANVGALSAILSRHDVLLHDADNHASLRDGTRLSFAKTLKFAHNNVADLERALATNKASREHGLQMVAVESVYSMSGDVAPLADIAKVCRAHDAALMVDEAHGLGVLGGGQGGVVEAGISADVTLIMGTFSKAFASVGGFIAAEANTVDFLRHCARALVFSAALPPASAASALAALTLMKAEPEHVQTLSANARELRSTLVSAGFDVATTNSSVPVVCIPLHDASEAFAWSTALLAKGFFVNAVMPPALPTAGLRISVMATHTREQIAHLVQALCDCRKTAHAA